MEVAVVRTRRTGLTTRVHQNGSRFAGDPPAPLEALFLVLRDHPLGDFWRPAPGRSVHSTAAIARLDFGPVQFWGNFADISHGFSVDTDDPVLIARLTDAILENLRHPPRGHRNEPLITCPCRAAHLGEPR
jgi:hypothetical protein